MHEHPPCPAGTDEQPPLSWWLRGLLATAAAMTGVLVPPIEERVRWHCPFCSWETAR
jgi:hypothetical protein